MHVGTYSALGLSHNIWDDVNHCVATPMLFLTVIIFATSGMNLATLVQSSVLDHLQAYVPRLCMHRCCFLLWIMLINISFTIPETGRHHPWRRPAMAENSGRPPISSLSYGKTSCYSVCDLGKDLGIATCNCLERLIIKQKRSWIISHWVLPVYSLLRMSIGTSRRESPGVYIMRSDHTDHISQLLY